ncbi:MAG TPA: efflux RND transporter periplasmic adaptor subunit, partial [Paracoccaceae bacterium]|nr:efflux RND transporter periplasmic adaptor subunit [Paracoccaceae bacterium]
MRNIVEVVLAIAILVVGGSVAVVLTGAMPQPIEAHARSVVGALGMGGLLDADSPAAGEDARRGGGFGGGGTAITAAPVRVEPFVDRIRAVGTGQATESVTVATSIAGLVAEVHFTSNTLVEAGEPLVTLDREAQAIALESARAQYAQAKAVNDRYQASGQRSSIFSTAQIEEIETALAVAEAALRQAEFEYDRRVIRAPFSGRVGLDDISVGQHLSVGAEIVRLDDISALEIEFLVPEADAADATIGTPVRAMSLSLPGRVFEGEIVATDSHIDPATRTLRVRARIPNDEQALIPGATFSIEVPVEGATMPVVPALAVQWSRDGAYVWRIRNGGVERVPVVTAKRDGDDVFVEATLDEGALVAV